jgi:hypothetical protein
LITQFGAQAGNIFSLGNVLSLMQRRNSFMPKIQMALILAGSLITLMVPVLADNPDTTASASSAQNAKSPSGTATSSTGASFHQRHPGYPKEWVPSKRDIEGLGSLTEKQRNDIGAIYSDSAPQYAAIELEYHELRQKIWDKVQDVLTPAQVDEILENRRKMFSQDSSLVKPRTEPSTSQTGTDTLP